uniref:Prp18 domain-containing protein n=1 Tax=Oryza barthii TaxID=65489 RepID=A0A0D3FMV8_9ORYZ
MLPEPIDLPKTNAQKLSIHPPIRHAEPPIRLSKIQSKANPLCECATATHPHSGEPMDVLKRELQRKRQLLDADFGGRKLLRRAEIERREMERIREAERRLLLQKQLRSSSSHHRAASRSTTTPGVADVEAAEIGEGQTNDFLRDIQALRAKAVAASASAAAKPKAGAATAESGGETREEVPFEELCDEDKIMTFFKRLMSEWSQEMDEMPEAERQTAKGKAAVATCKQCARYLEPLFKLCKKKALPEDVRGSLLEVVRCCMRRDYLAAVDNYIKLAIGNSPWPIGVTMVGIHERSAREKIYANSVAHIMNDETTRKYLQSVKRLMTFCQRKYPTDPSRSVEFNSLANGSDLQSLLAEQNAKNSEETLRLVAAS